MSATPEHHELPIPELRASEALLSRALGDLRTGDRAAALAAVRAAYEYLAHEQAATDPQTTSSFEAQINELHRRLLFHIQETPIGYIEWDTEARVRVWNRAAEEIFGWSAEEMLGERVMERLVPERLWPYIATVRNELHHKRSRTHSINANLTRDGREITCDWYNTPLLGLGGEVVGWAALVRDISAQIEARRELERLNGALQRRVAEQMTLNEIAQAIGEANSLSELVHLVGQRLQHMLGALSTNLLLLNPQGRLQQHWPPLEPDEAPESHAPPPLLRQLLSQAIPQRARAGEFAQLLPSLSDELGAIGASEVLAVPLVVSGAAIGAIIIVGGAESHATSSDALRLLTLIAAHAAGAIARLRLLAEAEDARDVADAASRAKSQFLATMSHELRTPLTAVIGYAQMLIEDESLSEEQHRIAGVIERSGSHQLRLINDLLDLARIEAGHEQLIIEEFALIPFLNEVADIVRLWAQRRQLQFYLHLADAEALPARISGDGRRLRQILINLIGNAIKFTDQGSVSLIVARGKPGLRFTVEDTGPGIAAEELERIFLPFQRVDSSLRQREGVGLGLAITRELLALMGSQAQISSTPGVGSRFWFELAVAETSTLASQDLSNSAPSEPSEPVTQPTLSVEERQMLEQIRECAALGDLRRLREAIEQLEAFTNLHTLRGQLREQVRNYAIGAVQQQVERLLGEENPA